MIHRSRSQATLWCEKDALDEAATEAASRYPLETGGVLLGWRASAQEVVVTHVVGPGPAAEHRPTSMRPDAAWQQERITDIYSRSGRRTSYLGDWHTHPDGAPSLSPRDISTLRRIARHRDARASQPVMVVLAGGSEDWELGPYQLRGAWALRPQALTLCVFDR